MCWKREHRKGKLIIYYLKKNFYFLQVFKCKCLLNKEYYAIKEIPKINLYRYNQIYSNLNEPHFLKKLIYYDFISKIICSFQDFDNIYLITTYYEGKSLNYFKNLTLTEEQIKFVSACIIQSLIYLRKQKIIHRDIMMKNILMDKDRYFNIIDFSFSINYKDKDNINNYMVTYNRVSPPEMLKQSKYDYNSDYYRLGSIIYYLIFKNYPYIIRKEKNITDIFVNYKYIKNYSSSCIDFLNKLIISNFTKRIGFKNINELIKHYWFKDFDWIKFKNKQLDSPFKFLKNEEINKELLCSKFDISLKHKIFHTIQSKKNYYKNLIHNFDYVNENIIKNISFK